ncbi:Uncharacterized protein RNJ44_00875 [Nakaseomyces bracarensis]|uniref:PDZ GRASP-type domain-containing protein n=1 Tax=Nakaseomyces bracarensis TaxID=273131 RepID=A0ABR4NQ90_9SACH
MFRIAKNLVKTFEQSVQETLSMSDQDRLDGFFQSIPPNILGAQINKAVDPSTLSKVISGLRVVYVDELQLQLESYFDFIVGIDDDALPLMNNQHGYLYPDYNEMIRLLNIHAEQGTAVKLNVWSAKGGTFRDEYLSLKRRDLGDDHLEDVNLSNDSPVNSLNSKNFEPLGFKVQWTPLLAATFTYHVLQLNIENGPAHIAGLIPDEDYIIGAQDGLLATGGETLLQDLIRTRANHDLVLYVYNKVVDCVRPVTVNIGPDGRLGCGVGFGFLHRIPTVRKATDHTHNHTDSTPVAPTAASSTPLPQQTFDQPMSEETFVPGIAKPPITTKSSKKHAVNVSAMGDYFNEGKDQSSQKKSSETPDVPPPPMKS